jgi:hypothetical protein
VNVHTTLSHLADIQGGMDKVGSVVGHLSPMSHRRSDDWVPNWYEAALNNVPRMPSGHTRIDPNIHHRTPIVVKIDRKHFDEQAAYDLSYRGF